MQIEKYKKMVLHSVSANGISLSPVVNLYKVVLSELSK